MTGNPWFCAEVRGGKVHLIRRGNGPMQPDDPFADYGEEFVMSAADAEALAKSLHKAALSAVPHPNDLLTLEELRDELPRTVIAGAVINVVHNAGIRSLGELRQYGRRRLQRRSGIGPKTITALEALLASKGLEMEP